MNNNHSNAPAQQRSLDDIGDRALGDALRILRSLRGTGFCGRMFSVRTLTRMNALAELKRRGIIERLYRATGLEIVRLVRWHGGRR